MSLPMREAPQYNVMLPLSGKEVSYRPFLVKEQKNMLIANQEDGQDSTFQAVVNMLKSVTSLGADVNKLPLADIEFLFLQIRAKSIGETAKVNMPCQNFKECDNTLIMEFNLAESTIDTRNLPKMDIELSEDTIIELRFPTSETAYKLQGIEAEKASRIMLRECMVRLHDKDNSYEFLEYRDSEIDEYIENLTIGEFEKLADFFVNIPQVEITAENKCNKCGTVNKITEKGLQNFF